jgi:hypothetical protein
MWLSADMTLSDMGGSFASRARVNASVVPLARERKNPETPDGTVRVARSGQSGSGVSSANFPAGGPNLEEPFGLIFLEIRKRVAFCLLLLHFAARTRVTEMVPDGKGES